MNGVYTHKPWRIAAVFWNGRNFPEVQQFFRDYVGPDKETGIWNEPDEGWPTEKYAYNIVQFYYGDDIEVDPQTWIIVHLDIPADQDPDHQRIQKMDEDEFQRTYDLEAA